MAPFAPSYGGVGLDPVLVVAFSAVLLLILGISAFVIMRRRKK
ncbi:PEP-CTERM sorting domain-containing protein [Arthrobacter sp. ISL-48]|nr:PEP-CTERM sorting domain-containing protein [Arthrobacter sp. ISL-48]MBT2531348.1 PEP-CTERM sorting domain-containing protein [Arthrobacter sp. ISL-48]